MTGKTETLVNQVNERRKLRLASGMPIDQVTELWLKETQEAMHALTMEALDLPLSERRLSS